MIQVDDDVSNLCLGSGPGICNRRRASLRSWHVEVLLEYWWGIFVIIISVIFFFLEGSAPVKVKEVANIC